MFCALAENYGFFKDKLNLFIAFAPVVKIDGCTSSIINMMKDSLRIEMMFKRFAEHELMLLKPSSRTIPRLYKAFPALAKQGIKLISDDDPAEINHKSIESFLAHYPAGTSLKSILHFKQLMNRKEFEYFDYGEVLNL